MAILGLDVGTRRIGVAVSDPQEAYALPVRTLERRDLHDDLEQILTLAREYDARTIVVGDPISLGAERGLAARKLDEFAAVLGRAFAGKIERVDERLTTALANRLLIGADVSRSRRKRVVDQLAAVSILDTYLARRRRATESP